MKFGNPMRRRGQTPEPPVRTGINDPCPHLPEDWPWISVQVKDKDGNEVAMIEFDRYQETIGGVWFAPGYTVVGQEPGKDWKLWC